MRAALNGVGLRHAMLLLDVQEHLAAGRLESVLEAWLPPYEGFFLYYSSRAHKAQNCGYSLTAFWSTPAWSAPIVDTCSLGS